LQPPPCLAETHAAFMTALGYTRQAADLILDSLALTDAGSYTAAVKPIEQATALVAKSTSALIPISAD
jgi:hypothetical protein